MFDQFELIRMDQRSNKDALRHNNPNQDDECESKACRRSLTQESHLKAMSKLAQRAQREYRILLWLHIQETTSGTAILESCCRELQLHDRRSPR